MGIVVSFHDSGIAHWSQEPWGTVRCPRFSVFRQLWHPKGWTPNKQIMESLDLQLWMRSGGLLAAPPVHGKKQSVSIRPPQWQCTAGRVCPSMHHYGGRVRG